MSISRVLDHLAHRHVMHEHVVHRLLQRVRIDPLRHRQVALRVHVARTARGDRTRPRPRRCSSVVVVFATPPFWLANAMTLATSLMCSPRCRCAFAYARGIRRCDEDSFRAPKLGWRDGRPALQAPAVRHRQGRRRQVDRGGRTRAAGRPPRQARDRRRSRRALARRARARRQQRLRSRRRAVRGREPVDDLRRSAGGDGGVPRGPAGFGGVAELLGSSRTFTYLAAATPGMRELLCVGKLRGSWRSRGAAPRARTATTS